MAAQLTRRSQNVIDTLTATAHVTAICAAARSVGGVSCAVPDGMIWVPLRVVERHTA